MEGKTKEGCGSGSCGNVYKATKDGKDFAIKIISKGNYSAQIEEEIAKNFYKPFNSPYLIKYYHSFSDELNLYVVMEYCGHGDLSDKIDDFKKKGKTFDEKVFKVLCFVCSYLLLFQAIMNIFIRMALALQVLHSNYILHRDVKAENVFLGEGDELKLGLVHVLC
jgi:serine/threonine protein kinase